MFGYVLQKPTGLPETVWACKTCVDDYSWKNRNQTGMIEFSICTAEDRVVCIERRAPMTLRGTTLSCVIGDLAVESYADTGIVVEISSIAVRFPVLFSEAKELDENDFEDQSVLLIPAILESLSERELLEFERLFYQYIHDYVEKSASSELLCFSIVFELLSRLDRLARRQSTAKKSKYSQYYVMKADAIINSRFCEKLTLGQVASELGITPAYLSLIYKRAMGIGFSDRLFELRIKKAEQLLVSSSLSVSKIAEQVGIGDESNLRKRFKQYFGTSMREYRCITKEQTLYHKKPLRKGDGSEASLIQ